jgi:uncharacterized membrane protein YqjE
MDAAKRLTRRLLAVGENRLELLLLEMQEEGDRVLRVFLLALGTAALGLLAGVGFSAAVVIAFWDTARLGAVAGLTIAYAAGAGILFWRLSVLRRRQQRLPETMNQLKKDRACLEKHLS